MISPQSADRFGRKSQQTVVLKFEAPPLTDEVVDDLEKEPRR